jgi:hypothetical protein
MDDIVFMVRADSRAACQAELDRLCELLGARPTLLPNSGVGRGWVARAVPKTKAPDADGGRGSVVGG